MQLSGKWCLVAIVGGLICLGAAGSPAAAETMKPPAEVNLRTRPIEEKLICQCGCTMIVANCDCGTAEAMRTDIAQKLDRGMSEQAILAAYVAQYGEKVIAYPEKTGFNWVAWVTPFVALFAGGGLLYYFLRRWVGVHASLEQQTSPETEVLAPEDESRYESRLEDILKKHF